jgi:hypothetical protein
MIVSIIVASIAAYGLWKAVVSIAREFYAQGRSPKAAPPPVASYRPHWLKAAAQVTAMR